MATAIAITLIVGIVVLGCLVGRALATNMADDASMELWIDVENGMRCVDCHTWIGGDPPFFPRRCEACRDKEWQERGGF